MHLGPFGVLWITGAVSRVGCPVVGGCRALAVAGSSSGESASRLPALLPLHPAGFPTSGGGISTGRRMDGEVPPRREHVDEEGERLSHSRCRWCDDPVAPRLVGRLRDVLAATVGVTVDRGQRQVLHRQPPFLLAAKEARTRIIAPVRSSSNHVGRVTLCWRSPERQPGGTAHLTRLMV